MINFIAPNNSLRAISKDAHYSAGFYDGHSEAYYEIDSSISNPCTPYTIQWDRWELGYKIGLLEGEIARITQNEKAKRLKLA